MVNHSKVRRNGHSFRDNIGDTIPPLELLYDIHNLQVNSSGGKIKS